MKLRHINHESAGADENFKFHLDTNEERLLGVRRGGEVVVASVWVKMKNYLLNTSACLLTDVN